MVQSVTMIMSSKILSTRGHSLLKLCRMKKEQKKETVKEPYYRLTITSKPNSEPTQKSKLKPFVKTSNGFKPLTIFARKTPPQTFEWVLNTPPKFSKCKKQKCLGFCKYYLLQSMPTLILSFQVFMIQINTSIIITKLNDGSQ